MSYNYLPLDRKPLIFDQIINLLDYDQLVSITFDAHEQILLCRDYLDKIIAKGVLLENINAINGKVIAQSEQANFQQQLLTSHAFAEGEAIPKPIVKLTLMLKIKSLSHGKSGIDIETVKRLMEMYNNDMLPALFSNGSFNDTGVLSQLSLPLIGLGNVYYKGILMSAKEALDRQGWQPLQLKSKEAIALMSGYQFTNACGLFYCKLAFENKVLDVSLTSIITKLIDAANTPTDAIMIDFENNNFDYQTVENAALVAAIEHLRKL
jgi:histidine ammonia-lyase